MKKRFQTGIFSRSAGLAQGANQPIKSRIHKQGTIDNLYMIATMLQVVPAGKWRRRIYESDSVPGVLETRQVLSANFGQLILTVDRIMTAEETVRSCTITLLKSDSVRPIAFLDNQDYTLDIWDRLERKLGLDLDRRIRSQKFQDFNTLQPPALTMKVASPAS